MLPFFTELLSAHIFSSFPSSSRVRRYFLFFFYNFTARKRDAFDPVFAVAAAVTRLRARKVSLFLSNARVSTPRRRRFNIYRSSPANLHGSLVINSRRVLRAFQPSTPGIMRLLRQFRGSKLQKYWTRPRVNSPLFSTPFALPRFIQFYLGQRCFYVTLTQQRRIFTHL